MYKLSCIFCCTFKVVWSVCLYMNALVECVYILRYENRNIIAVSKTYIWWCVNVLCIHRREHMNYMVITLINDED